MDAQLKAKWVEALRSGKYRQTRREFEDQVGFCCLGVLCKVAGVSTSSGPLGNNWEFVDSHVGNGTSWKLAMMNDSGEMTFHDIADYIEKNL